MKEGKEREGEDGEKRREGIMRSEKEKKENEGSKKGKYRYSLK